MLLALNRYVQNSGALGIVLLAVLFQLVDARNRLSQSRVFGLILVVLSGLVFGEHFQQLLGSSRLVRGLRSYAFPTLSVGKK